jgi:hypothetical protein
VLVAGRRRAGRLPGSAVAWWLGPACVSGAGAAIFGTLIYGGPLRSGSRPGEITFSLTALGPNLRYMPAHLIQAMPVLVLGLAALAGTAVAWLRRRAGGPQAAAARRDLAVAVALAACRAGIWVLYATCTWTAAPGLSTLQAARFYMPALGAISLLGAWLLVRVPRSQPLAAITTLAAVAALSGLGSWAFHDMYQHPFGPQLAVVPDLAAQSSSSHAPEPGPADLAAWRPTAPAEPSPSRPPAGPVPARHHDRRPIDAPLPARSAGAGQRLATAYGAAAGQARPVSDANASRVSAAALAWPVSDEPRVSRRERSGRDPFSGEPGRGPSPG